MIINNKFKTNKEYIICQSNSQYINLGNIENYNKHYNNDIPSVVTLYPSFIPEYYELLNNISNYAKCNENNILITHGSGSGLELIIKAFTDINTNVLIPSPNYPGFIQTVQLSNANSIFINFTGFEYDLLTDKIHESNVIYFSNPNLPLGYKLNRDFIIKCIGDNPDKLFIIDEAYYEYSNQETFANLVNVYKNLIITRTFSKTFILAGARIGYVVAHQSLVDILRVGYCSKDITNTSIIYANNVLKNKEYYLNNVKNDLNLLKYIDLSLDKIIEKHRYIYEYIINDIPWILIKTINPQYVCDIMKKKGYLVRNKSDDIKDCIRITLGTQQHMDDIINIIREINYKYNVIFLDLDITLREDYKSDISIELQETINELQKKYEIIIITDNYQNNEDTKQYLITNNINCNLISPISHSMNPDNKKWFIYDNAVYIIQYPDDLYNVLNAVDKYKLIRVIEMDETINSGELGIYPNIILPHIGFILNFIKQHNINIKIEIIGKSNLPLIQYKQALMIGDSKNDEIFAYNNNYNFIKVNTHIDTLKELTKIKDCLKLSDNL